MRKIALVIIICYVFVATNAFSQKISISIGPTAAVANIIEGNSLSLGNDPQSFVSFPGYSLRLAHNFTTSKMLVGIGLSQEYLNYGVYVPYRFPADGINNTTSKLKIVQSSFKLGMNGFLGYRLNDLVVGVTVGYDVSLSQKTKGYFEFGFDKNETMDFTTTDYSGGNGASLGLKFEKHFNKFSLRADGTYKLYNQKYVDEVFLHEWIINPLIFGIYFGFKI